MGALHHVEVWVPDLAVATRRGRTGPRLVATFPRPPSTRRRPDTYAAYLADNQSYEAELIATGQRQ
ncbi:hypothetical protein [Micromonospora orduensis]|uniref:hypothetical protein n=1 Tax=Micromonospora orduensis TaxID=1420891 RepID=UPI001FCB3C9D|nr:hypothetical protein [Micromonospora orduensis]